jgi:hypothetical protein
MTRKVKNEMLKLVQHDGLIKFNKHKSTLTLLYERRELTTETDFSHTLEMTR